jgi:D-alanyl-D-alanine dipeptidase
MPSNLHASMPKPTKPISIAEPVTDLRRIPIREVGDPLVNFLEFCPGLLQAVPRYEYRRETLVRRGVAERLNVAIAALPEGYRLAIIEGWRPPYIQRRMHATAWYRFREMHPDWSDTRLLRFVNALCAPMNPRVPPPHTTGAAIDVELHAPDGTVCDLMAPHARREFRYFKFAPEGLNEDASRNRAILKNALAAGGITNYPSEYWHYSYGDQGWAYRGGHEAAIYGPITPDGWTPDPADDTDALLVFKEG